MKPILAIYKNSKEFKGILREKKKKKELWWSKVQQTNRPKMLPEQKTEHNTLRKALQCSHPS